MSGENVEIVRRCFEVWNAGDMDALRELYDLGIIWRPPEGWPEPGPYAGREAVMRQLEQMRATWDANSFQLIGDFIDVDSLDTTTITHNVTYANGDLGIEAAEGVVGGGNRAFGNGNPLQCLNVECK